MRLFWQNLTREDDSLRGIWRHGRAALIGDDNSARISWSAQPARDGLTHVHADINEHEREATFSVSVFGVGAYLTVPVPIEVLDRLPFRHLREEYEGGHRKLGLSFHDGKLWYALWEDTHSWKNTDPKWMRGTVAVVDLVIGRQKCTSTELDARVVEVPFPEGSYTAEAKLTRRRWERPRLPARFAVEETVLRLDFGERPVWIPGKGENDYDQGDDGIYTSSVKARSIDHGVGRFIDQVMNERLARGQVRPEAPK